MVLNRWGEVVFETTDVEDVWYGPAGEDSEHYTPNGTYAYQVVLYSLSQSGDRKEVSGFVTVIR
jgi:hypothetical protein